MPRRGTFRAEKESPGLSKVEALASGNELCRLRALAAGRGDAATVEIVGGSSGRQMYSRGDGGPHGPHMMEGKVRFVCCDAPVHMMGVMAASRTKRLRIGTAVSLAPFYNPLRLAEEVALLDVLSGGRVNWGAGRGFERSEFVAFGIAGEESASRFHETVDIVLKAWTNEKLSY